METKQIIKMLQETPTNVILDEQSGKACALLMGQECVLNIFEIPKLLEELLSTFDQDELLQRIVIKFKEYAEAAACTIYRVSDDKKNLVLKAGRKYDRELVKEEDVTERPSYQLDVDPDAHGIGITACIALKGEPIEFSSYDEMTKHQAWSQRNKKIDNLIERCESFIGVPLKFKGEVIGVIKAMKIKKFDDSIPVEPFTDKQIALFKLLSNIAAIIIKTAEFTSKEKQEHALRLVGLYDYGTYLEKESELDRLIFIFLSGLTHYHGGGFNRAIYFEYDHRSKLLKGKMAIGPLNLEAAEKTTIELSKHMSELTIEKCIKDYDEQNLGLSKDLQDKIKAPIKLEEHNIFTKWVVSKKKIYFEEFEVSSFSGDFSKFLNEIEADKILLICIGITENRYNFVICDNINSKKTFDSSKNLLDIFTRQMYGALTKIYIKEKEKEIINATAERAAELAAHKLGNTLPPAETFLKNAKEHAENNQDVISWIDKALKQIEKALQLKIDFKKYLDLKNLQLNFANKNIIDILTAFKKYIDDNKFNVEIDIHYIDKDPLYTIKIDIENMNGEVIYNLVLNTTQAQEKTPSITISARPSLDVELNKFKLTGDYITIIYEDDGPGIEDSWKDKIFKENISTKRSSGLGLYIARIIIEKHGGIIFENGEFKKGARFNILLPIYKGEFHEKN